VISSYDGPNGWPILHRADYSKGSLYVLTIPENFSDLYELPVDVLTKIKRELALDKTVLEAPGKVSLFLYDNNTLIVESFLDEAADVKVSTVQGFKEMKDLLSKETIKSEVRKADMHWGKASGKDKNVYSFNIKPHSYRVFKLQ
jgi:hypothetical protein